ncbi:hypothetical protein HNY73_014175 [Argiope bruennichi]|uniref:Uncharacterized protein n=1 Tax=Argiope bruennichi TaxID=94029 RepID=A0A8T0EN32_ARGBR|nr:hypothetical protein HNY73_014175 [Argiope bruennichi]
MHVLNVWSELDELLESTRNKDSLNEETCLDNFKHSVRTCLPIIKAYAFGLGKGDLKVLRHFMECISLEIKSCDETTRKILFEVMEKNVLGRVLVSGDSMESLKECLEVADEKKLEKCAPGLSNFLLKVTYEDLIISVDSIILSNNSCILEALNACESESLEVISELVQVFLNITIFKPTELTYRQMKWENFVLMPDDRKEIRECLGTSNESEVDACVPGLFNLLESIADGEPQGRSLLRSVHQRTACLGIAFRRCPGSTRFIIRKTIQSLYGITLDIPFDRNSILSLPGKYETHVLEILFPYYRIPENVAKPIRECLEKTVCRLNNCCGELSDAMVNVLLNKSLQFPISQKSECTEPCYSAVFRECSEESASHTARLLYSVKLAYNKLEVLGITHLPSKPPYKLPVELFESINLCLEHVDPTTLENCCPGIIDLIHAYVRNRPIPFKFVTPRSCKYECVLYATSVCDITSASHLQSFIALAIKMYESFPSTSSLVQQEDNNFGIERVNNKITIPQMYVGIIATCINDISTQLNSCCPSFSRVIHDILNNIPVDNCKEDLKWCTKLCYEPLFLQCKRPEIMLQLATTILEVVDSSWDDLLFIIIFPPEPPYRFPRDIITGINLCLEMVESLERCCPLLPAALRTVVDDKPWISQKFNLTSCEPSCYKFELNYCPAESRDITLGLMIGLIHYNEISIYIYNCLQIIKTEFSRCCPGMIDILFNTFMGNEHCKIPDEFEKTCDISCTMKSLRKCDAMAADIVQKIMKYVFEYEPICMEERNVLRAVNKKTHNLDEKVGNKTIRIDEKKKTTSDILVTAISSEFLSEAVENYSQINDRKNIMDDLYEDRRLQEFRRTDNNRHFVESYDNKNIPVTESSIERQGTTRSITNNSHHNARNNIELFTGIEFGGKKSSKILTYHRYDSEESEEANAKDSEKISFSENLNREKDRKKYNGLKSTVKYLSYDEIADLKMGENLWRTRFNDEENDNEYSSGILESGILNLDVKDGISSTMGTNDTILYEYDASNGKKYSKDLKQIPNVYSKEAELGLKLRINNVTDINNKKYFNIRNITVVPEGRYYDTENDTESAELKDETKEIGVTSTITIFHRQNKHVSFVVQDSKGSSNETKKEIESGRKVSSNNFNYRDDVIIFTEAVNNEGAKKLEAEEILIQNDYRNTITDSWNTTPEIQGWKNGFINSSRISFIESVNTPHPDAAFFKMDDIADMNRTSDLREIMDSKEALGLEKVNDSKKQTHKLYTAKNVSKINDNKKISSYKVKEKEGKDNVGGLLKSIERKRGMAEIFTEYPLEIDDSGRSRIGYKQVDLSENSKFADLQIFDSHEDIIRIQDTKRLVNGDDVLNFDEEGDIKKLRELVSVANSSGNKDTNEKDETFVKNNSRISDTDGYRYRAVFDLIDNNKNNDTGNADLKKIDFASLDVKRGSSENDTVEVSDYDILINITDKNSFDENAGVTEISEEFVASPKSYESADATSFPEGKNDGGFTENFGASIDTMHSDVNFTILDQETTTVITHIKKSGNVEFEISYDYMNTNEDDDLENSKELSQIGRKRRVAVDNQHLEKKDKIDKHMKLRKKNKPRKLYEKTYRNKKLDFADGAIDERIKVADHSDKNISSRGIGLETTNTEADIISFSDSKINLTDEEKDVGLTSSWFYNNDAKYNYNKAAKNVSKFKTKFGNIKFDKNAERNVKINNSKSKKRSFIAKRQISNDNNKDTAYTLRSGTFRKISHKISGETANEPFDLGDLVNIREEKNETNIFSNISAKKKTSNANNLDNNNESGFKLNFKKFAKKNFQSSESDRIEKEEISFEETEGPLKMNLKEVVSNSGNIYDVMKSSKDEENVWPSDGESAAEIGIIEQLPSLYGKIAFEDDFVFRDADGDPSSEVSFSTVEAETSVIRCTKVMSPILRKCCRPLLEALYALINDEQRPLDEPNLKRCDHFCYRAALKYCSPKAARITSSVIRKIKGYPLLGDVQFGAICNKTIHVALNYCCDLFVLNFYQGNYNYEEKTFKEPECAQVCQKSIFQLCFHFKPLQEYFKSLIKSYFRKKNILGLYTISTNSSQIFPVTQNKTLINAMLYRQIRTTFAPNLKYNYNEPCNTLSKSAANNLRHRRQVAAGTAYTRERKTSFHRKEAFRIPAHFKKLARMCIYMIQNSSLDNCVQGIYDYILMLSNGVKTNQPILTDISKASSCLGDVFNPCSTESILVLNSLLQQFLEDSINIINVTAMKRKGSIDEKTKEIVNLCLNRAGSDLINNCIGGFYSIIKEILDKGHSTIDIDLTNEGVKCLSEVLSICSLKARIALMRLMLEYEGVLLNISFMPQSDHINIMKLISGEEKRSFAECFKTLSQEEMNACEPELYSLLSELTKGSMRLLDVPLSGNKECLTDAFKKCSFHSRLVIMDLITFITDNTIDIPLHFPKETPVPITMYKKTFPDLSKIPVRIAPASCLKNSFANCSADSRLFLTELVHRYTNVFVDLLFFISKDNIDQNLLNIASECIATIPVPLLNGCIKIWATGYRKVVKRILSYIGVKNRIV